MLNRKIMQGIWLAAGILFCGLIGLSILLVVRQDKQSAIQDNQSISQGDQSTGLDNQRISQDEQNTGYNELPGNRIEFSTIDLNGTAVTDDIFTGHKLTLVNVWTTTCNPCMEEMPDLSALAKEYPSEEVQILTICHDTLDNDGNPDESQVELARSIIETLGVDLPVLLDSDTLENGLLDGVQAHPATFFVDANGQLIDTIAGRQSKEEWQSLIAEKLEVLK